MEERLDRTEERTEAEGLTFEFLEAQDGSLLPDRIEMRRKRKRKRRGGGSGSACGLLSCIGVDIL